MAVDPSIPLSVQPVQLPNALAMAAQYAQLQDAGQRGQLQNQAIQQGQRALDAQKTLSDLYSDPANVDPTTGQVNMQAVYQGLSKAGHADTALALAQKQMEVDKARSEIGKNNADAGKLTVDTQNTQFDLKKKMVDHVAAGTASLLQDPTLSPDAIAQNPKAAYGRVNSFLGEMADAGYITHDEAAQTSATLPPPQALRSFLMQKAQAAMTAQQALEANTPKLTAVSLGNRTQLVDTNPNTNRGQPTALAHGVSPDTAATIQKDYNVAGLGPNGQAGGEVVDKLADAYGNNRLQINSRTLSNPVERAAVLKALDNPNYSPAKTDAMFKAVDDFMTGTDAGVVRSQSTSIKHLAQLGEIIDKVDNNNFKPVNQLWNPIRREFGNADLSSLDAAKTIAGREILKAITAGGGGVSEAQDLNDALHGAKTTKELRAVINTWSGLLASQRENMFTQRDATTGLPASNFPNYENPTPAPKAGSAPVQSSAASAAAPATGTVVPTKSEADYKALPSGAWYSKPGDPPGTHRVKQ